MKRFGRWVKSFFFPPSGAPLWIKVLPYALLGFLTLSLMVGTAYAWDYTNSSQFCGTTCHTMPPEFNSYLTSPHARIKCVECHIGRDFITTQITRKAGDIRHVTKTIFHKYQFPITADDMRPARETCEKCHFPEKFSNDSFVELKSYLPDKDNTPVTTYLDVKTGGGTKRIGLGKGIHWHVENPIYYYPTDKEEQNIPYIRVMNEDGSFTEYTDLTSGFDPNSIDPTKLKEMDCITCHNRITHLVNQPDVSIDEALTRGLIDASIPEIKLKGVEVLRAPYSSSQEGLNGIAGLEGYYQAYYPDYYAANQAKVQDAIKVLQDIYTQSVFPEQKSSWDTHPNNIGHMYSPGCFRCHDGKHLDESQQAIRLECNLCHSIPKVAGPQDFVTDIEISRGPEPETHKNANWITLHRSAFDATCSSCHTTDDPGGVSNTSFCSNSACHGSSWTYAGFDAPALRSALQSQIPTPAPIPTPIPGAAVTYQATILPILNGKCGACHNETANIMGLNLTTYEGLMKGSSTGPVVVPGDPTNSMLVAKQSGAEAHFGQLSPSELQIVIDWIEAGAPKE